MLAQYKHRLNRDQFRRWNNVCSIDCLTDSVSIPLSKLYISANAVTKYVLNSYNLSNMDFV